MTSLIDAPAAETAEGATRPVRSWRAPLLRLAGAGSAVVRRTVAIAAFLALWELAPRLGLVNRTFLVPFSDTLPALWHLARNGQLWSNTETSLARALTGFALAIVIAVPLGLVIGWYRRVAELLGPLLELFRNTAALALLPVFILVLGIGETSKVSIVVYACLWPVLLNTVSAVRSVDPTLVKSARSLGLPAPRIFQKVVLPASVPAIFTGIRMAGANSILVLIAAEMVGAKSGLGYFINSSQQNFAITQMYAGIITISVLGLAFNQLLLLTERYFTRWRAAVGG